jgi:hypothetical protein
MMMTVSTDRSRAAGEPARDTVDDVQIDKETGLPVSIPPDGEKVNRPDEVDADERLRVDPNSRIPRPVQPDLA